MTSEHSCGYCDIGSYEGMIELVAPSWSSKKTICVDICIALEITSLWQAGIRTTGCCCGHGKALGYIGVWEEDIQRMIDIGYVVRPNETDQSRKDGFYPKTKLLLTSEQYTPSADTLAGLQRYEFDRESGSSFLAVDKSERAPNGDYVLYSQAAEIIAAKQYAYDVEYNSLVDRHNQAVQQIEKWIDIYSELEQRAEAAEAKLAQIKAQDPVGYVTDRVKSRDGSHCFMALHKGDPYINPVYATPVSDSLKAEALIDKCRKAVRNAILHMKPEDRVSGDLCDDVIYLALSTLKEEASNDKG